MSLAIIENPDKIECTLQFTMSLGEWKEIRKTLKTEQHYTQLQIINEITNLVSQLERTLLYDSKKDA